MSEDNTEYQGFSDKLEQVMDFIAECSDEYKTEFFMKLTEEPLFRSLCKSEYTQEPIGVYERVDGVTTKVGEEAESDKLFKSGKYKQ